MKNRLMSRNIVVNGRRTSMRLEEAGWEAIDEICSLEGITLNELCTAIDLRNSGSSRTAAVRAFIFTYFRLLARESGHQSRGRVGKLIPGFASG